MTTDNELLQIGQFLILNSCLIGWAHKAFAGLTISQKQPNATAMV